MDMGPLLTSPTQDPDWKKKLLLMGLLGLVPLLGLFNLYGYLVQVYRQRRHGETALPPAGLGYIVAGIEFCIPVLPILCLLPSVYLFQWGLEAVLHSRPDPDSLLNTLLYPVAAYHWHIFVGYKVLVALLLLLSLFLGPVIAHLYLSRGHLLASLKLFTLLRTVVKHPGATLLLWVMVLSSGLVASLGVATLGVGAVLTIPYAMAVLGASFAAFDERVREAAPSVPDLSPERRAAPPA
jgi:hypothetical protein